MNIDERIEKILDKHAEYYIKETVKFFNDDGDPPGFTKNNKRDIASKNAIKQLIDEALQAELISLINDGKKKVYERIFDRIKELQND